MIPAAAYAGYSSDLQDEMSITGQLDEIRAFAAKNGYEVVSIFADRAERGSSDVRPQFLELQAAVKSPTCPFKAVIAWKSDRIARKYELAAGFRGFLRRRGVALLFVAEPNIDGPVGALLSAVMDGMNEFYSANLGENVKRGMRTAVSRGYASGGTALYGYRKIRIEIDGRLRYRWEIDPKTAPIVRRIYAEYAAGAGLRTIARSLNEDGVPAARGGKWNTSQVHALLFDRRDGYLGRLTYGKCSRKEPEPGSGIRKGNTSKTLLSREEWTVCEDAHPALITPELSAAVDAAHSGRTPISEIMERTKRTRLLSGLLRCGVCGKKYVVTTNSKGRHYYACYSARWETSCGNRYVPQSAIESAVKKAVVRKMRTLEKEILRAIKEGKRATTPVELRDIAVEREAVKKKQERLIDAISEGVLPFDLAGERLKALQNTLERLAFEEKELQGHFSKNVDSTAALDGLRALPEGWQEDEEVFRALLLFLVDSIEIHRTHATINYKIPVKPSQI